MPTQPRESDAPTLTLVVGGTGKTGRRVARRLAEREVPTRVVSRSTRIPFDWEDPATWAPALDGVTAAYVTYSPDLAVPGAPAAIEAFCRLAVENDVNRLVLLSGRGEEEAERCERIAFAANPEWTVVRASWFSQNFSESFFLEPLREGTLVLPAGDVGEPFVDVDDIADVAVAALTETGHEGRLYEVTGPRLLTFTEAVEEIARATGRDLAFREVSSDDYVGDMRAHGVPESILGLTRYLFDTVLDGRNSSVADGVERALGRPARDFSAYVRATAATGVWDDPGKPRTSPSRLTPPNAEVLRRFVEEIVNGGDWAVLDELVDPDYVFRSPGEEVHGPEGVAALIGAYRQAFPDLRMEIGHLLEAGDTTVASFTLHGTHRGELLGSPATGLPVEVHGMLRSRFRDGRLVEEWEILDQMTLFEQLGLVRRAS